MTVLPSRLRSAAPALVAAVIGLGAALAAPLALDPLRSSLAVEDTHPPGDRVLDAAAALREAPVHVTPDGERLVDAAQQRRIERLVDASEQPVHVVVWSESGHAGYVTGIEAVQQIAAESGLDGTFLLYSGSVRSDARAPRPMIDEASIGWDPDYVSERDGQPALELLARHIRAVDAGSPEAPADDGYGGTGGAVAFGVLVSIPGLALIGAVAGWLRYRDRRLAEVRGRRAGGRR